MPAPFSYFIFQLCNYLHVSKRSQRRSIHGETKDSIQPEETDERPGRRRASRSFVAFTILVVRLSFDFENRKRGKRAFLNESRDAIDLMASLKERDGCSNFPV
jgi:hypothetical protein